MKRKSLQACTFSAVNSFVFCVLVGSLLSSQGCQQEFHNNNTCLDFETDEELDLFRWKCRSMFSLCPTYGTHGDRSLKMAFFPTRQVGFSTSFFRHDWRHARAFQFSVFNPSQQEQSLFIKISDDTTKSDPLRSFRKKIDIDLGENLISIPVSQLYDSFSRKLNLRNITGFYIYMKDISSTTVLYFDYFRLT